MEIVDTALKNTEKCCRFFNAIEKAIEIGIKDKADVLRFLKNHTSQLVKENEGEYWEIIEMIRLYFGKKNHHRAAPFYVGWSPLSILAALDSFSSSATVKILHYILIHFIKIASTQHYTLRTT